MYRMSCIINVFTAQKRWLSCPTSAQSHCLAADNRPGNNCLGDRVAGWQWLANFHLGCRGIMPRYYCTLGTSLRFTVVFDTLRCVLEALQARYLAVLVTPHTEYRAPGNTTHGISDLNSCHLSLNVRIETDRPAHRHRRSSFQTRDLGCSNFADFCLNMTGLWRNRPRTPQSTFQVLLGIPCSTDAPFTTTVRHKSAMWTPPGSR